MPLIVGAGARCSPTGEGCVHGCASDAPVHDGASQSDGEVGADGRRLTARVDGADRQV